MNTPQLKLVVVGDRGVGKTAFLERHHTGAFVADCSPTLGVEVKTLAFTTNKGEIMFNAWDVAGDPRFAGASASAYCHNADCGIVMCDLTRPASIANAHRWVLWLREHTGGELPVVLVANQHDRLPRDAQEEVWEEVGDTLYAMQHADRYLALWAVSAKTNYNFEKPFLTLARHFLGADTRFEQRQFLCAAQAAQSRAFEAALRAE